MGGRSLAGGVGPPPGGGPPESRAPPGRPPPKIVDTRRALHRLAFYVVAPARKRANTKFGLRWTFGGFGTPFFGADEQVRVAGRDLVVQRGDAATAEPITT